MPFVADLKDRLWPWVQRARLERDRIWGGNCVVLLYHRVFNAPQDPQRLCVSPENFDAHLSLLNERFRVLSMEEFDHYLLGRKRFPKNSVFITFDDGYADNHRYARPLLEKHHAQGLFYISSGYIGSGREYWWDELERLLLLPADRPVGINVEHAGVVVSWNEMPKAELLRALYERLLVVLRPMPSRDRDVFLDLLSANLPHVPDTRADHLAMDHDELLAFSGSPAVFIGAHTVGHPSLAGISVDQQRHEVGQSRRDLEQWLSMPVDRFAYPFGTPADHDAITRDLVRKAGFRHAAANHPGIVHARSPHFAFNRVLVRDGGEEALMRTLAPFMW